MPRVSQSALELLPHVTASVEVVHRLRPPAELTEEQAIEFQRAVERMPADWFCPGNIPMLAQYARHVVLARHIAKRIDTYMRNPTKNADQLAKLIQLQEHETAIICRLMTKLRLTPQAVQPRNISAKKVHEAKNPWVDN